MFLRFRDRRPAEPFYFHFARQEGSDLRLFSNPDKPKTINQVVLLPTALIQSSPHQPRRIFAPDELDSLARSIAQNGLLTPISVRPDGKGGYLLIAGERRLLACRKLGMTEIPAIVSDYSDADAAILTMVENIHREGLDFFEEAEGIAALIQATGYSQSRICLLLDMAQSTLANKLRLLRLPEKVRDCARQFHLSERMARALLALPSETLQLHACSFIAAQNLNSAQAEKYIRALIHGLEKPPASPPEPVPEPQAQSPPAEPPPEPVIMESLSVPSEPSPAPAAPEPSEAPEPESVLPFAAEVRKPLSGAVGYLRDSRILLSTIDKAVEEIRRSGILVETDRSDEESCFCYLIRIPKAKRPGSPDSVIPVRFG